MREGTDTARGRFVQIVGWLVGVVGVGAAIVLEAQHSVSSGAAIALAAAAVVASVAIAAGMELRARARLRSSWLDRLHQLTDDLAGAVDADDPAQLVRDAAARASADVVSPRAMDGERAAFLRSVADLCAQAHERIELHAGEQRARADLELIARAYPRLAASLDVAHVTATIQELVVPEVADRCVLRVLTGPAGPIAATSADPDDLGVAVVPLVAGGHTVGEMVLGHDDGPIGGPALETARLLAEPAARALAHALRFTEEAHASSTLQESLLPTAVLPIPGLEVATRYLAATEGQAVGGDFYDVVRHPDGTALLMVGDVQGKGIEAAALTSTARHTLRTAALAGETPAGMLRRVNQALLYADAERLEAVGSPSVRFVTAVVVALQPSGSGFAGVVASGGHPPPLLIRPEGGVEQVIVEGPLLGVFADARFQEHPIELRAADLLVLYTDGVTERRRHPEVFDERQLGRLVRNQLTSRRPEAVAQLILDTVVSLSPRDARDDIALIVARVTGAGRG
jgi:serine phosphatase RsbU (regulator of sigma subunit)